MGLVILRLIGVSLIPIAFAVGIFALDKYTKFKDINKYLKQLIIGLIFGGVSILGTVFGVTTTQGAVINVRDASPIIAGLIFSGPAGILAGFIGGLYRFVAVYFGAAGAYTQIACAVSTFLAGVFTALIKKFVFGGHHGDWYYGLGLGVLCEDFHMLMVFFTHMDDVNTAYTTVMACFGPMVLANSLAVAISIIIITLMSKEKLIEITKPAKIASVIQLALVGALLFAYLGISFFTYFALRNVNNRQTNTLLTTAIHDVQLDVDDSINRLVDKELSDAKRVIDEELALYTDPDDLIVILKTLYPDISEISFIGSDKKIKYSSTPEYVNYDMASGEQSNVFNTLISDDKTKKLIQEYQGISYDSSVKMKYAGATLNTNTYGIEYVQIGFNTTSYHKLLDDEIENIATNRHVGNYGYIVVCTENGTVLSKLSDSIVEDTIDIEGLVVNSMTTINYLNYDIYYYAVEIEGYYVIASADKLEQDRNSEITFLAASLVEIFVFLVLYCIIYVAERALFVEKIKKVDDKLEQIREGNLDTVVNENKTYEFKLLSEGINNTVNELKGMIEQEKHRMEKELEFAKAIQSSALPSTFPAFPNRKDIEIYASMDTAKEVGGDFYDFYFVDETHFAIQIADVSGKGIPAAMFMMRSKTIIKDLVENGMDIAEAFTKANKALCEGNDQDMFVTAWLGVIDTETGHLEYVNAGHNPPLILKDNKFEYLKSRAGFVLAGLEDFEYKKKEIDLNKGDAIYLYTDGVTEATSKEKELFGEDRLIKSCEAHKNENATGFINEISKDVNAFVNGAEQADDITMLAFKYIGK